jgi:2-C-methyl-D-erythritol 4-phosphate cytidylyltransferase
VTPTPAREPVWLILVAAGRGERLGGDVPKALRELGGRPLFAYALEAAAKSESVTRAVLIAEPEAAWAAARGLSEKSRELLHAVVRGGALRRDSVCQGLHAVRAAVGASPAHGKDPVVLVHDAARPFAPPDLFTRMAGACARGPAVAVRAAPDTVKEVDGGVVRKTLERGRIVLAQTPQGARLSLLERAHDGMAGVDATDDAALLEALGETVAAVPGSEINFKVTTPEDLRLAEAWVRAGGAPWMERAVTAAP